MSHAGDGHGLRAAGKLQRWAAAGAAAVAALAPAAAQVTSGLEAGQASARTKARALGVQFQAKDAHVDCPGNAGATPGRFILRPRSMGWSLLSRAPEDLGLEDAAPQYEHAGALSWLAPRSPVVPFTVCGWPGTGSICHPDNLPERDILPQGEADNSQITL